MNLLCWLFGHKVVGVIETRYRPKKNKRLHRWERDPRWNGKPVKVSYCVCDRCGKKLSNARRFITF